jgi:hypothetical protein
MASRDLVTRAGIAAIALNTISLHLHVCGENLQEMRAGVLPAFFLFPFLH